MSDKIKVLQINREINKEVKSVNGKKVFKPVDELWYDDSSASVSLDFDRNISIKKKINPKISLVQNANSHFFKPDEDKDVTFKKEDIGANQFETLNIVDRRFIKRESQLPEEILKMRSDAYHLEQEQKDILLEKLNVNLKHKNNFNNYDLTKMNDIPVSNNKQFIDDVKNSTLNKHHLESDQIITPARDKKQESLLKTNFIEQMENKPLINEKIIDKNNDENSQEVTVKPKNKLFDIENHTQNEDLSIPVIRDFDKTYTEHTDDLQRAIKDVDQNKTKLKEQNKGLFETKTQNDTTMLVNRLASDAKEISKINLTPAKFDDFESWVNGSQDSSKLAKLAKLAKKEKKRIKKNSKGK